jgi:hypothetical protein
MWEKSNELDNAKRAVSGVEIVSDYSPKMGHIECVINPATDPTSNDKSATNAVIMSGAQCSRRLCSYFYLFKSYPIEPNQKAKTVQIQSGSTTKH